jgi:hypothetical protein
MKIVIESAKPELEEQLMARSFRWYPKFWNVTGYTWDGECMCTKKPFQYRLEWPELDCGKRTMELLLKKAGL